MVGMLERGGLGYQGGFVDAGGLRVHYLDYGPTESVVGAPETVMLIHGGGAGAPVWTRQIAALSKKFRVIAPDNPMFGLSVRSPVAWPIEDFTTSYLVAFLDALGVKKASIAGLSLGGFGGLFLAIRHPERVARLALLDAAGLGTDLPWVFRLISVPGLSNIFTMPLRSMHDSYFSSHEVEHPDTADCEAFKRYAYAVGMNEGHGRAVRQSMPAFTNLRGQRRIITDLELARVQAPTLVIWGAEDKFFPVEHGHRASKAIQGATLHVIAGAGHVTPLDAPDEVSGLLSEFFER